MRNVDEAGAQFVMGGIVFVVVMALVAVVLTAALDSYVWWTIIGFFGIIVIAASCFTLLMTYRAVYGPRFSSEFLERLRIRFAGIFLHHPAPRKRHSHPATWSEKLAGRRGRAALGGTVLLAAAIGPHALVTGRLDGAMLLIAVIGAGIVLLDFALLRWRVVSGVYGTNRNEAEELLAFVTQRSGKDGDPPRRAVRDPLEARETEPARPEGAVAGAGT